jgi:alpha-tubulin suppressor-like RCC1 family protein
VTALDETEVIEINVVSSIDIMEYKSYTSYFVLEKSGKVYSWGKNDLGQLGVGDFTDRLSPTLISTLNEPILKIYSISYSSAMNGNFVSIFALAESGKVYSWGRSEYGILGIPDPDNVNAPKLISTLSNVKIKSLSSVGYTMFAIDDSSQVYSWGLDDKGQLGRTDSHSLLPAQITTFKNIGIKEIVDYPSSFNLNMKSVFAIATNGNLYAWGDNEYGQLGTGDKTNRLTPVLISSSNILKVITEEPPVSDSSPFFAISDSGEVYFWGNNKSFQLGLGKDTPQKVLSVTEISSLKGKNISQIFINGSNAFMTGGTGESILALDKDGKLYSWGFTNYNLDAIPFIYQYSPQLVEIFDLNKMVQNRDLSKISAGYSHSLAIHDGQVYSCGSNDKGQLGLGDAVERHSPSLVQALQGKNITQVVAGESFSLALDDNGEVYSFGDNSYGELGLGDNKVRYSPTFISSLQGTKIIQIAVRGSNNVGLALAQDGVLYAWGWIKDVTQNTPAPLDSNAGMSITEISSGGGDTLIFDNNKLYVWSFNGFVGVGISNQDFFVKGSSGSAHMHAMTEYGNLYSWGDNSYGQLGLNTTQSSSDHPIFMSFFEGVNIHLLEAGGSHSFAVSADDKKVYSWGLNQNGQLGIGNNLEKNSPEEVTAFKALNIVQVKAGKTFSLALDDKNNIYSFGNNDKGQLGLGHTENQNLPQLVKFTHSDNKNHSQSHMLEALYIGIPVACSAALITGVLILAKYKKIWCFSHKSPSEETLLAH